jgi:hypothetical protein
VIKDPFRSKSWNSGIEDKPMVWLREVIPQIIGEAITQRKLEWGNRPHIMVITAIKLNAKIAAKEVGVRTAIKLRAKTVQ